MEEIDNKRQTAKGKKEEEKKTNHGGSMKILICNALMHLDFTTQSLSIFSGVFSIDFFN